MKFINRIGRGLTLAALLLLPSVIFAQTVVDDGHEVLVSSFPDGASIVIDGVTQIDKDGTPILTPAELKKIAPGKHTVTVSVPGWTSTTTNVNVLDVDAKGNARDTHLTFVLMPTLTTGPTGATGAQGPKGDKGDQGIPGASGVGTIGSQGLQGIQGVKGDPGIQGIQGVPGKDGAVGNTGAPGSNGNDGAIGPQGFQGTQGFPGLPGLQGPQGAAGVAGNVGATGATGAVGPQGPQGPAGVSGISFKGFWTADTQYNSGDIVLFVSNNTLGVYINVDGVDPADPSTDQINWARLNSSGGTAAVPQCPSGYTGTLPNCVAPPPPAPVQGSVISGSYSVMANISISGPCGGTVNGTWTVDGSGHITGALSCNGGSCTTVGSIVATVTNPTQNEILLEGGNGCNWGGSYFGQLSLANLTLNSTGFVWNISAVTNPGDTQSGASGATVGITATLQ